MRTATEANGRELDAAPACDATTSGVGFVRRITTCLHRSRDSPSGHFGKPLFKRSHRGALVKKFQALFCAIWLVILLAARVVPIKQEFIVNLKTAHKVRLVNMTNLTCAMKSGFFVEALRQSEK
jgi:hypothetical protein